VTKAARQPLGNELLQAWTDRCGHHRAGGLKHERNRALSSRADGHLGKQGGIWWFPLEEPPKIEVLHQAEHEAVLEGRVEREMHKKILTGGHLLHEAGAAPAAPPGAVEVEGKEPATGGHPPMKLNGCPQGGVEKNPSVIGRSLSGETCFLQEPDRSGPVVEYQQVHVPHGAMGNRLIEALGERGALERQTADAARREKILDSARRVELAHPKGERLLLGAAERHLGRAGPPGALLADCLMKKAGEALFAGHLYEQARHRLVRNRGQFGRDEPAG
jgi:hypothetical protein